MLVHAKFIDEYGQFIEKSNQLALNESKRLQVRFA